MAGIVLFGLIGIARSGQRPAQRRLQTIQVTAELPGASRNDGFVRRDSA